MSLVENLLDFFLNLEKNCVIKSQTHPIIIIQNKITDQVQISKQIFSFYKSFFSHNVKNKTDKIEIYLEHVPLPKLTNEQTLSCKGITSDDEVFNSLKSMEHNKSPYNDGLSKEYYECFWDEIKNPFSAFIERAVLNQELSSS